MPAPVPDASWRPLTVRATADLLAAVPGRWWLSGGVALDHWRGRAIRPRGNIDVSTTAAELTALVAALPDTCTAWAPGPGGVAVPFAQAPADADPQPVRIREETTGAWVLQVNVEDGSDAAWMYKRDPRLQLPWDRAVLTVDAVPTGAPEVQLVWKALRPRPEDDTDKDAVFPDLSDEARAWYERTILRVHPHSTWSIHVRSPFAPAKASWNRTTPR